ncbi:uncharacterized protein GGS22DRAFT_151411 [Annulohypoxylon maeteangense]|uniref:uncharacterized protein n=1 Tax=Annulohypoxylon maeteangense TaxID=1927788 RepID=UPI00200797BD|nr:uncharacterized protein GGS22DRAFT_151411 [Annulohypoxylon maeteangense]KAI0890618.1 hypothetical protein GGS22DRAFT_151411 [Annulohypoxylon maeteangense]
MARATSSEGALRVSRSYRETGRKRHRIPSSVHIPFESSLHLTVPNEDHHMEDEPPDDDDDDNDTTDSDESDQENDAFLEENAFLFEEPPGINDGPVIVDMMTPQGVLAAGLGAGFFEGGVLELDIPDPDEEEDDQDETNEADEADDAMEGEGPPQVATWRMNLTALSQVYNIYMVAYRDKIYVSRPRSCVTNALPVEPDLILQPEASTMGISIGGYLDDNFPHQVNHLIVRDFGNEEILLLAYDDGDVIGYYTRHIENELLRREKEGRNNKSVPNPFFHENVEKSAWGLAVHKQSRIIAASSNTHNVSVFVFALTGHPYRHTPEADEIELFRNVVKDDHGEFVDPRRYSFPDCDAEHVSNGSKIAALESAIRRRDANWRIVLETGRLGVNIPNIDFSSDADGEADKVVAVDINGRLWLMDIWSFNHHPHVKIDGLHLGQPRLRHQGATLNSHKPRGWGVLVLPESSFLPMKNKEEAIGMALDDARYVSNDKVGRWVDISLGIKNVENNSRVHPWVRWGHHTQFAFNPLEPRRVQLEVPWCDFGSSTSPPSKKDAMGDKMSRHERESRTTFKPQPKLRTVLRDGSSIMRTYEMDIELRSFEEEGRGIMFEKVIDQLRPSQAVLPLMRVAHERLANLIHVPELSLVVAASLCGRVALITLTRPEEKGLSFKRAFRVEAILPTAHDEDSDRRPICPLLGVAIGPIPFSGSPELADKPINARPYRIMLHFYDLSILSYDLSRCSATDSLSIS